MILLQWLLDPECSMKDLLDLHHHRRESTMNKKPKRIRENEEGKSLTHAALFVFKSFYCFGSMCLNPFLDSKENN